MSFVQERFQQWLRARSMPVELKKELMMISDCEEEICERFYQYIPFGTGGMRGLLGAGTNRMNIFTIRRVAQGLAKYVASRGVGAKKRGVVIAYDTRCFSLEFAQETAKVLATHGIHSYVFKKSRPTPMLSFAVRYLNAFAGVVITASHNPKQYNGFKVYGAVGGQLTPEATQEIINYMDSIKNETAIETMSDQELLTSGYFRSILSEIDEAYSRKLRTLRQNNCALSNLTVVYTPLHGSGLSPVLSGLKAFGCEQVFLVEEQAKQDPEFPTVKYPNPEESDAFQEAIRQGKECDADILLATDPDADRLGVAVKVNSGYQLLTGNQLGALLLNYLLSNKSKNGDLPSNGVMLKTIVTSELGRTIAEKYGVTTVDTLTGFKYISEKIEEYHQSKEFTFLFGYEESYGYLIGDFVRDKDAVQASLLTAEMASYYKSLGKSLYAVLQDLYKQYGYYKESVQSLTLEGVAGRDKICRIMNHFRRFSPDEMAGKRVVLYDDYLEGKKHYVDERTELLTLPKENVVKFVLEDESWVCIRPSGTEPKCKIYFGVKRKAGNEAEEFLLTLEKEVMSSIEAILNKEKTQ